MQVSGQRPGRRSGPRNRLLCQSVPVLSLSAAPRADRLTGAFRASRAAGFFAVLLALGGGLALFVPAAGAGARPGREFEYVRHGTISIIATMNVTTGQVIAGPTGGAALTNGDTPHRLRMNPSPGRALLDS